MEYHYRRPLFGLLVPIFVVDNLEESRALFTL
jgi:hypothetical protein